MAIDPITLSALASGIGSLIKAAMSAIETEKRTAIERQRAAIERQLIEQEIERRQTAIVLYRFVLSLIIFIILGFLYIFGLKVFGFISWGYGKLIFTSVLLGFLSSLIGLWASDRNPSEIIPKSLITFIGIGIVIPVAIIAVIKLLGILLPLAKKTILFLWSLIM